MSGEADRIVGRYAFGPKIAAGGMATVHAGRVVGSIGFTRTVAIKRLHERYALDPKFVSMFVDEARLAARVRHPNVVPTLDVVVDAGEIFVILEYVHGEPLSRLVKVLPANQRFPVRIASAIAFGTLLGLHAAHDARNERGEPLRIVHRDVSPQNIVVGPDGVPRVLDFGIAKAFGRLRTTEEKEVKGKLAYMSPEQLAGDLLDQRTDVYSASIILWELLAGKKLFTFDDAGAVLQAIMHAVVEPPSHFMAEPSARLDAIVMRGLARKPADRWPTARAMALALEDCIPPATPPHVGAFVERIAHKELAERAMLIAALESGAQPITLDDVLREIQQSDENTEKNIKLPE
ncbi:MAG TPA: serine/threonine-protein kinase [Polyangiaceae bacterium]|jgi:serine/threonine-protein kinase|nr:serine/threonine-protein kinase [Polyangiaceae bacterium]